MRSRMLNCAPRAHTHTYRMQWLWNNGSSLCLCRLYFSFFLSLYFDSQLVFLFHGAIPLRFGVNFSNSICSHLFTAVGKIGIGGKLENLEIETMEYYCIKMQMQAECIQRYSGCNREGESEKETHTDTNRFEWLNIFFPTRIRIAT